MSRVSNLLSGYIRNKTRLQRCSLQKVISKTQKRFCLNASFGLIRVHKPLLGYDRWSYQLTFNIWGRSKYRRCMNGIN